MSVIGSLLSLDLQLTVLTLAGAAAVQSLVGLWAATSTRHWFVRALVMWGAVTALIPIRAYEPALIFAIGSLATMATIPIARRFIWRRQAGSGELSGQPPTTLRFGLGDLFLLTLILGLFLTDLIQILKKSPALRWSEVLLPTGVVATVACLSHAIACGPHRMLRSLSLAGAIVLSAWLLWPNVKWLYNWDSLGLSYYSIAPSWDGYVHGFASTVLGLFELSALVILGLVALTEIAPNRGRLTSVAVRICQGGGFVAVLALALLYWQMLWLAPLPPGPVSDVNRFDQILRIAEQVRLLNGSSLAISELRETNPTAVAGDELQTLYNELLPLLEASNALPFGPENCTDEFFSGTTMQRIQTFRALGRSLQAESKAAAEVSDFPRAAAFSQANFGLGLMLCRGGLEVDELVGHAVVGSGTRELATIRGQLDPTAARTMISALRRIEAEHEPLDVIFARDIAFTQRAYGWTAHLSQIIERQLHGGPRNWSTSQSILDVGSRTFAINHLFQVDLALRVFHAEHEQFPETLDELVPDYLPELPLDPSTNRPLAYRSSASDFVLYSVGRNGIDDGGQFTNWLTQYTQDGYDLDLDTLIRP